MDRRGDTYRPSRNDHRSTSHSRPSQPSRRNSRFDVVPKDARSPNHSSSESPRSPRIDYYEETPNAANKRLAIAKDPRKQRETAGEALRVEQGSSSKYSLQDVIREWSKQVLLEEQVKEAESSLKTAQQEQRKMRDTLPSSVLESMLEEKCNKAKDILTKRSQLVRDSQDRVERMFVNLPRALRDLLCNDGSVSLPVTARKEDSPEHSNDVDELKNSLKSLTGKLEILTKQNIEQEAELKTIREQNSKSYPDNMDCEVDSKISAVKKDVDTRFDGLDKTLQKLGNNFTRSDQVLSQQQKRSSQQDADMEDLRSKQAKLAGTIVSLQKRAEQTDIRIGQEPAGETPASRFSKDQDDELSAIKEQQKEQKYQIASLSTTFVSCMEYKELRSESEVQKEKLQKIADGQDQLRKKLTEFDVQVGHTYAGLEAIRTNLEEISGEHSSSVQEQIKNLSSAQEMLKQDNERLDQRLTQEVAAVKVREPPESERQVPSYDHEEFSRLKRDVKSLTDFSEHYKKFYDETKGDVRELNKKHTELKTTITEVQNSIRFRFGSVDETCQEIHKGVVATDQQIKTLSGQHTALQENIRNQISMLKASSKQSMESLSAQMKPDIENLKVSSKQVNHSIQSLDARFNAISTQKLYHAIVATIQPLLPEMYDINGRVKTLQNAMMTCEQKITQLDDKVQLIKKEVLDKDKLVQSTEIGQDMNASLATAEDQDAAQTAPVSERHEDSSLQATVLQLKKDVLACSSQSLMLKAEFGTLSQSMKDQTQNLVTTDNLGGLLEKAWDELVKKSSGGTPIVQLLDAQERYLVMLEEIQGKITDFEATVAEDRKIIDGLRADVEIVDDLQSRVQNTQTEMTTHQRRLDKLETGMLQIDQFGKRLDERRSEYEQKISDNRMEVLLSEVKQTKEELAKLCQTVFPVGDRYLVLDNVASVINEKQVRAMFADNHEVKAIKIRGGKIPNTKKTSRYILIWIAASPDVDTKIDAMIEEYKEGKSWYGRRPVICKLAQQGFKQLWEEEPDSVKEFIRSAQRIEAPVVPTVAATAREASTTNSAQSEIEETVMVRSSVLPGKSSARDDLIELPDSEDEKLLETFGATRNGQKSSRPPLPKGVPSRPATPSSRAAKRSAPDLGSSRASLKKARRE